MAGPRMYQSITHVSLTVDDVPAAEDYYRSLLALEVAFRDVEVDGAWYGLAPDSDWLAADGCTTRMCALSNGALVLALEEGDGVAGGRLNHIGLRVTLEDLTHLRIRAHEHDTVVETNTADRLVFRDRYGVRWEVGLVAYDRPGAMGTGPRTGRWWPPTR
jgi:catechol 2,3-dioxygenase-like lactoylglutathione lyase family enzyme